MLILRATLFHVPRNPFREANALESFADGALLIAGGRIVACGDYSTVRAVHPDAEERDLRGGILLPGLIDTHIHYPQVRVIGGIGFTLLDWLERHAMPEEAKFSDEVYATQVASEFLSNLASHGTTSALVFGAHFANATGILMEQARASGLRIATGLVLSDRELRSDLLQTPERAYAESQALIHRFHGAGRIRYAVTPRFAVSTSESMLDVCRTLLREHPGVYLQTHLNETRPEIEAVARLFPQHRDYLGVYESFGLAGRRSIFAHSVQSTDNELQRLAAHQSSVAFCPSSNAALGNGFFPLARHLAAGVCFALGTDVGAGTGFGMLKEGLQAYLTQRHAPTGVTLNAAQLLYLATRAGAEALDLAAECGDFTAGKAADFVYLHPPATSPLAAVMRNAPDAERLLAAVITLAGADSVRETWVEGACIFRGAGFSLQRA